MALPTRCGGPGGSVWMNKSMVNYSFLTLFSRFNFISKKHLFLSTFLDAKWQNPNCFFDVWFSSLQLWFFQVISLSFSFFVQLLFNVKTILLLLSVKFVGPLFFSLFNQEFLCSIIFFNKIYFNIYLLLPILFRNNS